jgi:hypothetical protein
MFTQRHYRAVASMMQTAHPEPTATFYPELVEQWRVTIDAMADTFKRDNSKFRRDLFEAACVPGANVNARS